MDWCIPIGLELRDKIEIEWWSDYSSLTYSYPFNAWMYWKYKAKVVRPPTEGYMFDLHFNNEEEFNRFKDKWS